MKTALGAVIEQQQRVEDDILVRTCEAGQIKFCGREVALEDAAFRVGRPCLDRDFPVAFDIDRAAFSKLKQGQRVAVISYEQSRTPNRLLELAVDRDDLLLRVRRKGELVFRPSEILKALEASVPDDVEVEVFPGETISAPTPFGLDCTIIGGHVEKEVRMGDVVSGGLMIKYPVRDDALPTVRFYVRRLVCSNGLIITETTDPMKNVRMELRKWAYSREVVWDGMRRGFEDAWQMAAHSLEEMGALQDQPVPDPIRAIGTMSQSLRLSDELRDRVVSAYETDVLGRNPTRLGLLNAFTRVATHSAATPAHRSRLNRAAESILKARADQCPACSAFFVSRN